MPGHDCTPYPADPMDGEDHGEWSAPNTTIEKTVDIPDDRGGGYLTYRVFGARNAEPSVSVTTGTGGGAITGSSSAGTPLRHTRIGGFAAAPGQTYDVAIMDFVNCDYYAPQPCPADFTWTYQPLMDCYEPNDDAASAKRIPLNRPIEAYGVGGYLDNFYRSGPIEDWYEFTLDEDTEVDVTVLSVPSDVRFWWQVVDQDGGAWMGASASALGQLPPREGRVMPAGTYDLLVRAGSSSGSWRQGAPMPDAFRSPYVLMVSDHPDDDATCEPVDPVFDQFAFTATLENIGDSHTFVRKAEFAGSGFVEITAGGLFAPKLTVEANGAVVATAEPTGDQVSLTFEATPGETYTYRMSHELGPALGADFWGQYSLRNRNDCFEPNDSLEAASEVIEDQAFTAYFIAGHAGTAPELSDYADWYSFDVLLASSVAVRMHSLPPSVGAVQVRLFDEDGTPMGEASPVRRGRHELADVAAGRYVLAIEPLTMSEGAVSDARLSHVDRPYSLTVQTRTLP